MSFCSNCGKEINAEAKFCDGCGTALAVNEKVEPVVDSSENENNTGSTVAEPKEEQVVNEAAEETVASQEVESKTNIAEQPIVQNATAEKTNVVEKIKKKLTKKQLLMLGAAALAVIIVAVIVISVIASSAKTKAYEEKLFGTYELMVTTAEEAESYCSLESKVWRNCIYENDSYETDKYTKNSNGWFYDDFNDALLEFYIGEKETYDLIDLNNTLIDNNMSELKDCPEEFKDEYQAIKEMYIAYSDIADFVLGDSNYSLNTFTEALEDVKAEYKKAESAVRLLLE